MNIREALAAEHSKRQTERIVRYVGDHPARFKELMDVFLSNEYRPVQRASWSVNCCVEKHPELVIPYFSKLVGILQRDDVHTGAHRNILRMFQFVEIPKRLRGKLYDICTRFLDEAERPVGVRVFALTVAAKIADGEPALIKELTAIADKQIPHSTVALRTRAKKVLKTRPVTEDRAHGTRVI
ncbi:MAG TPA: hypothetical protein VMZ26_05520 [Pyrinomonadaceae bacterium]|nr:hypothetical protein [Pyrinomonadaceae bacterium]